MYKILKYSNKEDYIFCFINKRENLDNLSLKLNEIDPNNNWMLGLCPSKKTVKSFTKGHRHFDNIDDVIEFIKKDGLYNNLPTPKINYDVPRNKAGQNSNIKLNPNLKEKTLLDFGFTKEPTSEFYMMSKLTSDISFNIEIDIETNDISIEILDEDFLQPYDYQIMLKNPNYVPKIAKIVHHKVQKIMKELMDSGIIVGYKENDYI